MSMKRYLIKVGWDYKPFGNEVGVGSAKGETAEEALRRFTGPGLIFTEVGPGKYSVSPGHYYTVVELVGDEPFKPSERLYTVTAYRELGCRPRVLGHIIADTAERALLRILKTYEDCMDEEILQEVRPGRFQGKKAKYIVDTVDSTW